MKITINNLDLQYSIDTYGMFTGESVEDGEQEYYQDTYGLTDDEWFTIGFDYDHAAIVKALAEDSIANILNATEGNVVKSITLTKTNSPQFYNYTTDSYIADWEIDDVQLTKYIATRQARYTTWVLESDWEQDKRNSDSEYNMLAMLDFYLTDTYTLDDYNSAMWERENEIYYENMTLDAESQKLINSKEPKQ